MNTIGSFTIILLCSSYFAFASGPHGKNFGFGLVVGEPLGATGKFWNSSTTAFAVGIGGSYYGSVRLGLDYLWHFNAFNSSQVNLYAGPGIVFGFGGLHDGWWYAHHKWVRASGDVGVGIRGVMGVNFIPRNTSVELFIEAGPLINISPGTFNAFDFAAGVRYYP